MIHVMLDVEQKAHRESQTGGSGGRWDDVEGGDLPHTQKNR